jgi:sirohydrochlorin cobaltochelatase
MSKPRKFKWWLFILVLAMLSAPGSGPAAAARKPAIVLAAFGTSTQAFATYDYFGAQVKKRYPAYDIRWAFTSHLVRQKVSRQKGRELKDLATTLRELQQAGYNRVAVQSLHIVPGEEWEKEVVMISREVPGLKVALGKPLLSSAEDRERVLEALAPTFPRDRQRTAVVLVAHGSPSPQGTAAYLAFDRLLRSRCPNVFLGTVEGQPTREEALAQVRKFGPQTVVLRPFLFVAGEHVANDILGAGPESWKSLLLKQKPYRLEGITQGLGYQAGIVNIFLDHLAQALKDLQGEGAVTLSHNRGGA